MPSPVPPPLSSPAPPSRRSMRPSPPSSSASHKHTRRSPGTPHLPKTYPDLSPLRASMGSRDTSTGVIASEWPLAPSHSSPRDNPSHGILFMSLSNSSLCLTPHSGLCVCCLCCVAGSLPRGSGSGMRGQSRAGLASQPQWWGDGGGGGKPIHHLGERNTLFKVGLFTQMYTYIAAVIKKTRHDSK